MSTAGPSVSPEIKHVFVLMLENRSFDHLLGFSGIVGTTLAGEPTQVNGLWNNPKTNPDPAAPPTNTVLASMGAAYQIPEAETGPGHAFLDVLTQLCHPNQTQYSAGVGSYPTPTNQGFIASYRANHSTAPSKIMQCFAPEQLPVLTALATEFAVCDRWFSAMPGPTWPNRFFLHAASSGGLDDMPTTADQSKAFHPLEGYRMEHRTIFRHLGEHGHDWEIFRDGIAQVEAIYPISSFPGGFTGSPPDPRNPARIIEHNPLAADHGQINSFEALKTRLHDPRYSPRYVFIEPHWGGYGGGDYASGNSQHPLDDVRRGEELIKHVYETLRGSPLWEHSVLVITYDEHGGFYDHVSPPTTQAPGDKKYPGYSQHNFDFKRLGVRVPAVIVSPYVPKGTIDHTVYDHASILKTVEQLLGLEPLTGRDRSAASFAPLLALGSPRSDCPTTLPSVPTSEPGWNAPQPVAGVQADRGPALAAYGESLWMAWKSAAGNGLQFTTFNGDLWAAPTRIAGASTGYPPAFAVLNGTLYMAWLGVGIGAGVWLAAYNGTGWAGLAPCPGVGASGGPALAAFGDRLWMVWPVATTPGKFGLVHASFDGTRWSGPFSVGGIGPANAPDGSSSPALGILNSVLYLVWRDGSGGMWSAYATGGPGGWSAAQSIAAAAGAASGPALATYGNRLWLAWGDAAHGGIGSATFDGAGWWPQTQTRMPATYAARPAMDVLDGTLYLAWQGGASSPAGVQTATYNWAGGTMAQALAPSVSSRASGDANSADPTFLAFAHIAMLCLLGRISPADLAARERIIERFRSIETRTEAAAYVREAIS